MLIFSVVIFVFNVNFVVIQNISASFSPRQTWITQIGDGTPSGVIREFNRASGRGHRDRRYGPLMAKRSEGRKKEGYRGGNGIRN